MNKRLKLTVFLCLFLCIMMAAGCMPVQSVKADEPTDVWYGDVNDDGKIDAKDVTMLRRQLAGGWNVNINEEKADLNQDSEINAKDVTMLRRFLAGGWNVELPTKTNSSSEEGEGWKYGNDAGSPYKSYNYLSNNYTITTSTIKSYLYEEGEYFIRAEADVSSGVIHIEKYDKNYKLVASKTISYGSEYIWGGLYCGNKDNYVIIGQENDGEDDDRMVFRVIKYNKNWDKIDYVDINGAHTTYPFASGAVRCAEDDDSLFISATHTMYTHDDGIRHQASFVIVINKIDMQVEDLDYWNNKPTQIDTTYTSHCFNNFVLYDSRGNLSFLNQGDRSPRELILYEQTPNIRRTYLFLQNQNKYGGSRSNAIQEFKLDKAPDGVDFMESMFWVNKTGCSVGGFEETEDGYVVAYNYDEHGGQLTPDGQVVSNENGGSEDCSRNIYIYFVRNDEGIRTGYNDIYQLYNLDYKYKISYEDNPLSGLTPTAVSLGNDNGGVILWQERGTRNICYVRYFPDSSLSDIFRVKGSLSDCKPLVTDGKIMWYVCDMDLPQFFYSLDLNSNSITTTDFNSQEILTDKAEKYEIPVIKKEILMVDNYKYEETKSEYDNNGILREKIYNYSYDDYVDDSELSTAHVYYDSKGNIVRIETHANLWNRDSKINVISKDDNEIVVTKHFTERIHGLQNWIDLPETVEYVFDPNYNLIILTS